MDCQMPRMDGYEASGEIRRRKGGGRHLPIVAMTAGAMVDDRAACMAAGMDDYVAKPIVGERLRVVLDRWVGGADPADERRPENVPEGTRAVHPVA